MQRLLPWREIHRQQALRYSATRDVEDGVEQLPQAGGAAELTFWSRLRQQILDYLPAFLVEVGGVAFDALGYVFRKPFYKWFNNT
jgi:hypothetical protein